MGHRENLRGHARIYFIYLSLQFADFLQIFYELDSRLPFLAYEDEEYFQKNRLS